MSYLFECGGSSKFRAFFHSLILIGVSVPKYISKPGMFCADPSITGCFPVSSPCLQLTASLAVSSSVCVCVYIYLPIPASGLLQMHLSLARRKARVSQQLPRVTGSDSDSEDESGDEYPGELRRESEITERKRDNTRTHSLFLWTHSLFFIKVLRS